jgi:hypothetical protein
MTRTPRYPVVALALSVALAPLAIAAPSSADVPATAVTINVVGSTGLPVAGDLIGVYYQQFSYADSVGSSFDLPLLGSGTTDSSGTFDSSLDTTAIDMSELGTDPAGGVDAFNAVLLVVNPSGDVVSQDDDVMELGQDNDPTITVPAPTSAQKVTRRIHVAASMSPLIDGTVIATQYRYTPVVIFNNGNGLEGTFTYSSSSGASVYETQAQATVSIGGGPWAIGNYVMESQARDSVSPWQETNGFHMTLWANYLYDEIRYVDPSLNYYDYTWEIDHFTGALTDNDPDTGSNGKVIHERTYTSPAFTTNFNYTIPITSSGQKGYTRNFDQNQTSAFDADLGAWFTIEAQASYDTDTSMSWSYESGGCSGGMTRYVWGANTDPGATNIVQADCENTLPLP